MADESSNNPALDAFLSASSAPEAGRPPPEAPPQPQAPSPEPSKPEQPTPRPEAAPAAPVEEDAEPADDGSGTVPIAALRKAREDHKGRAARAEGVIAELRAQLEASKRPPPPAEQAEQRVPRQPPPDPARDPSGYHLWMQTERQNDKLDLSEAMLRRQLGDEAVEALQQEFKAAAQTDRSLWDKLYAAPDPYAWAHKQMQQMRVVRDVGTDPEAYRAKLRAEVEAEYRAKIEQQAPVSPVAGLPPSLANVRSSAPRGQTFSGPPPMEDIVGRQSGDIFQRRR
jgi:hypothetical protein